MSVKVLALGGSGGMGRFAVSSCMDFDNVEEENPGLSTGTTRAMDRRT